MPGFVNYRTSGVRFGKLIAISLAEKNRFQGKQKWLCKCDCGGLTLEKAVDLWFSNVKSCGCIRNRKRPALYRPPKPVVQKPPKTISLSKQFPAEYIVWRGMRYRCYHAGSTAYQYYGARGIKIEWATFESFISDMGPRPSKKHSIDRVNNNGNYAKNNCRWATAKEQANNKRTRAQAKADRAKFANALQMEAA